jgi:hypothetical protein
VLVVVVEVGVVAAAGVGVGVGRAVVSALTQKHRLRPKKQQEGKTPKTGTSRNLKLNRLK